MILHSICIALAAASAVRTASIPPANSTIKNPEYSFSHGGAALCTTGYVDLPVSFESQQWDMEIPKNQLELTDWIFNFTTTGTSGMKNNGTKHVSKTYQIYVEYCVPRLSKYSNSKTIQILTHGGSLDHTYWDFGPGYSYVDAAAAAGMATLNYDRLGIGKSDHPHPLYEVQFDASIAVLHSLNTLIRSGGLGRTYEKLVGVGHSLGSGTTQSIASSYPSDFDGILLTGFAHENSKAAGYAGATGYQVAQNDPRFRHLPDGYIMTGNPDGIHLVFFKFPNFDPAVLEKTIASMETTTLGEMLPAPGSPFLSNMAALQQYTGAVMVLTGDHDYTVCGFSCLEAEKNPVEATIKDAFSSARADKSKAYVVPNVGHNLNTHWNAAEIFEIMLDWVRNLES